MSNFCSTTGGGDSCANQTATGNTAPVVEAGPAHTIPISTPFELCGSGSDADGDTLTFGWEQFNLGPAGHPDSPVDDAPIFRSFTPVTSPCRSFPQHSDIVNNTYKFRTPMNSQEIQNTHEFQTENMGLQAFLANRCCQRSQDRFFISNQSQFN